jgi:hypothetical protein
VDNLNIISRLKVYFQKTVSDLNLQIIMKKLILLLLFIPFVSFGQGYWDNWHKNDIENWRNSLSGFKYLRSPSTFHFSGTNSFEGIFVSQNLFYAGATPRKQILLFKDGNSPDEYSTRSLFRHMASKVLSYSKIRSFSRSVDWETEFISGIKYEIDEYKYELGIFRRGDEFLIKRVGYNPDLEKLTLEELSDAKLFYETSGISELNPFDLKSYSEFFGSDLLIFHKANVSMKLFGWLGDGYLYFSRLENGVLGLANGMRDDCIEKIAIDPTNWGKSTNYQRLWTVYHEIAHDLYNIQHNDPNAGLLMSARIPSEVSFIDFFLAKKRLLTYLATLDPDDYDCSVEKLKNVEKTDYLKKSVKSVNEF